MSSDISEDLIKKLKIAYDAGHTTGYHEGYHAAYKECMKRFEDGIKSGKDKAWKDIRRVLKREKDKSYYIGKGKL